MNKISVIDLIDLNTEPIDHKILKKRQLQNSEMIKIINKTIAITK